MFRGSYQHALDEKGRTSLPVMFREALSARSEDLLIATPGYPERCVWLLTMPAYEELMAKIETSPELKEELRKIFVASAHEVAVDQNGRVLVPPPLREYAGLKDEVIWVGAGAPLEIWDSEAWKRRVTA